MEACSEAVQKSPGVYRRHRPEQTVLYRLVQEHLESYLTANREACPDHDPIPAYIERTFREYLACGILAHGFARVSCDKCGNEYLVAFSCKCRGLCPSCNTRRMAQTAASLVDEVLPRVPIRQWVLTVPKRIRWFVRQDRSVASRVLKMFLGEVEEMVRRCCPEASRTARFGAVAFTQRFGMSLNEHPHFHVLATDGVFVELDDEIRFIEATELDQEIIEEVEVRVRKRVLGWLAQKGLLDNADAQNMLGWQDSGGFSVDGSVLIKEWDRQGLERLARYCARPAFSGGRFALLDDGQVAYSLPKPDLNGRMMLVMEPLELLGKLAKLIPPPRMHQVCYYGVLAPNSHLRKRVIESAGPSVALQAWLEEGAQMMGLSTSEEKPMPKKKASRKWAMMIARIFEVLPLLCLRCNAPMRIVAFITEPEVVTKILNHLCIPSTAPVIAPARAPPQEKFCYYA